MKIETRDKLVLETYLCTEDVEPYYNFAKHAFKAESTERLYEWVHKALAWSTKVKNLVRKVMRFRAVQALMKLLNVHVEKWGAFIVRTVNLSESYKGALDGCGSEVSIQLEHHNFECLIGGRRIR